MEPTFTVIDKDLIDYSEMLMLQRNLFQEMVDRKKKGLAVDEEYLFMVEHNPVITLGRHAHKSNILYNKESLKARGINVFEIERGGDVTFHGPGQLVAYPLIDLEHHRLGVKDYVALIEETVIRTLAKFGIKGERIGGASGVWIDAGRPDERKIAALGVKCSRFITMHGLALNVNNDLTGFELINPCGFVDKGVTSMSCELKHDLNFKEVKTILADNFKSLLGVV